MKMIKYTLNSDGTIPDYVTDGGYLAKSNGSASPQDYDLIGVATDAAPQTGYVIKQHFYNTHKIANLYLLIQSHMKKFHWKM